MNHILITFLVILGAGAAVLLGYAVSCRFINKPGATDYDKMREELAAGQQSQQDYMAEVRKRTLDDLAARYC